jgi:hypothetical protein
MLLPLFLPSALDRDRRIDAEEEATGSDISFFFFPLFLFVKRWINLELQD